MCYKQETITDSIIILGLISLLIHIQLILEAMRVFICEETAKSEPITHQANSCLPVQFRWAKRHLHLNALFSTVSALKLINRSTGLVETPCNYLLCSYLVLLRAWCIAVSQSQAVNTQKATASFDSFLSSKYVVQCLTPMCLKHACQVYCIEKALDLERIYLKYTLNLQDKNENIVINENVRFNRGICPHKNSNVIGWTINFNLWSSTTFLLSGT